MKLFKDEEMVILNEKVKGGLPYRVGELAKIYCTHANSTNYDYTVELDKSDIVPVKEVELNKLTDEQKELSTYIYRGSEVSYIPTNETVIIVKVDYLNMQAEAEFYDAGLMVVDFKTLRKIEKEINTVAEYKFKVGDKVKTKTEDHYNGLIGEIVSTEENDSDGYFYNVISGDGVTSFDEGELELIEETLEQPQQVTLGKFTEIGLAIGEFTDFKNKQYGSSVDAVYKMMEVLMERYTYDEENYLMPKSLLRHLLLNVRIMDKANRLFNNPSGEGDSESPYNDITGYGLIGIDMVAK
jgi:hypothetical protein